LSGSSTGHLKMIYQPLPIREPVGGEFPIAAISGDSGPPIFPLEIDEHDQLGGKDTERERSVTEAYCA
jgi:hypothetical protein